MMSTGLTVSWKALLTMKCVLKLIGLVLALVVFILTASFNTEASVSCRSLNHTASFQNYVVVYKTDFPFDNLETHYGASYQPIEFDRDYGAMAQSFLAWGVISFIYCMVAIFAYVMLNESQEWKHYKQSTNITYVADFGGSILLSIVWLVVCVVWTVGAVHLKDFLDDHYVCLPDDMLLTKDDANFAEAYVAIAFGYASLLLWTLSIWWTFKETFVYEYCASRISSYRGGYDPIQ